MGFPPASVRPSLRVIVLMAYRIVLTTFSHYQDEAETAELTRKWPDLTSCAGILWLGTMFAFINIGGYRVSAEGSPRPRDPQVS